MTGNTRIGLLVAFAIFAIVGGYFLWFGGDEEPRDPGLDADASSRQVVPDQERPEPERPADRDPVLLPPPPPPPVQIEEESVRQPDLADPNWDEPVVPPHDDVVPTPPNGAHEADDDEDPPLFIDQQRPREHAGGTGGTGGKDADDDERSLDAPRDSSNGGKDLDDTVIPARPVNPPAPTPPAPIPPTYTEYIVKPNDTFTKIATEWFGDASKWELIRRANPYADPVRLQVGDRLRLPPKDTELETPQGERETEGMFYTVRSGDNLSRIAVAFYRDASKWSLIYEANRPTIGASPDNLRPGMRLMIPSVTMRND